MGHPYLNEAMCLWFPIRILPQSKFGLPGALSFSAIRATKKTTAGQQLESDASTLSDQARKDPSGEGPSEQKLDRGRGGRHTGTRGRELPGRGNGKYHEH